MSMYPPNRSLDELDGEMQAAIRPFIAALAAAKLPFRVWEAFRSQARQDYLYAQGRTRDLDMPKVTWTKHSNHSKRRAVDFVHVNSYWKLGLSEDRKIITDARLYGEWLAFGELAESFGLEWGGRWGVTSQKVLLGKDPYHVELP